MVDDQAAFPVPPVPLARDRKMLWQRCGNPWTLQESRAFAAEGGEEVLFSPGRNWEQPFCPANCWEVPQGCEVRITHLPETEGWVCSPAQGSPGLGGAHQDTPLLRDTITAGPPLLPDPTNAPDVAGHDQRTPLGWGHLV